MFENFKRWFFCRLIVTYEYDAWIAAGNAKHRDWNSDENFKSFLKWRETNV